MLSDLTIDVVCIPNAVRSETKRNLTNFQNNLELSRIQNFEINFLLEKRLCVHCYTNHTMMNLVSYQNPLPSSISMTSSEDEESINFITSAKTQ
jgi:hypothetical protein